MSRSCFTLVVSLAFAVPLAATEFGDDLTVDGATYRVLRLVSGDVDADGDLDLVSASTAGLVVLHLNADGAGGDWQGQLVGGFSLAAGSLDLGDVDGDGDLDVAIGTLDSGPGSSAMYWAENTAGDGSAWEVHFIISIADPVRAVALGDLDGDDDVDCAFHVGGAKGWMENDLGDGSSWTIHYFPGPSAWSSSPMTLADLDGDDDLDAVCVSSSGVLQWNENGNGWLARTVSQPLGSHCDCVVAGDIDADGDVDLAAPDYDHDRVVWWEQLTWFDEGGALAGALGEPRLTGGGKLLAGEPLLLMLTDAYPLSTATLVIGLGELSAPFKGGTLLPSPDLLVPGVPTSFGIVGLPLVWPPDVPGGLALWYQVWIADPGGPVGFAATNTVRSVAP